MPRTTDPERLDVKKIAHWVSPCPTGRHVPEHPGMTCEEADDWIAQRDAWLASEIAAAMLLGDREPNFTGLLGALYQPAEPTPVDRALQILAPHLAGCPLYVGEREVRPLPAPIDDREPGPCERHPTAPVIGGLCGGCTHYPTDMVKASPPIPRPLTLLEDEAPVREHLDEARARLRPEDIADAFGVPRHLVVPPTRGLERPSED